MLKARGQQEEKDFVEQWLSIVLQQQHETAKVWFHNTIHKNNATTFHTFYQLVKDSKEKDKATILTNASLRMGQKSVVADIPPTG